MQLPNLLITARSLAAAFLTLAWFGSAPLYAQAPPGPRGSASVSPAPPAPSLAGGDSGLTAEEIEELGEAAPIVRDLRSKSPKSVALIFDVSGSMRGATDGVTMLRRARNAASVIARRALRPGDDISLYTFGAGYDVFKKKIETGDDREAVAEKVPSQTGEGAGTNIRRSTLR